MTKTVGKKKMTDESTYGEIYNSTSTQYAFCGVQKYFIILLDGRVLFVSYLPFNNYLTISTILQRFSNVKLMKK